MPGREPGGAAPDERRPHGRERGAIGEFGTLEGRRRETVPGERGARPEPEMSVADQVYTLAGENIPINDTQQALFWAYDFWRRHRGQMATEGERRGEEFEPTRAEAANYNLVARKVIRFLRIRIAELGGKAEVRRNPDLQIELRRLWEDVTAMEQLLGGR
jgi:hypothetical protein